ncbi:MAG: DUF3105 domain-containing protein [Acidimicrobiia bacterium]
MGNAPKPRRNVQERRVASSTQASGGRPWLKYIMGVGIVAILVGIVIYISADVSGNPQGVAEPPPGTEVFVIEEFAHTVEPVTYAQNPPVGGPHHPEWLACRVYTAPVRNENAVHAMEHGAIWIAYDPDLDEGDIDDLEGFGRRREVIVSPYPGMDSAVAVSAWGRQLKLDSVDTDLIDQFYRAFQDRTAPETAASC